MAGAKDGKEILRLELGGGLKPKEGFINIDIDPNADVVMNLDREHLPYEDATVSEVYSSHCLEHLDNVWHTIHEICRVCKVGAKVTIKVPHYNNPMAMCPGHRHVISELMVNHFKEFPEMWKGRERKLVERGLIRRPSSFFAEARSLKCYLEMTDDQIMKFVSGTCHESEFIFTVESV